MSDPTAGHRVRSGSALPDAARAAYVRRRAWVWGAMALVPAALVAGSTLLAFYFAAWQRVGVDTVAEIVSRTDCRDVDDGEQLCRYQVAFDTQDGRRITATIRLNTGLIRYSGDSERFLLIRYDRTRPERLTNDLTAPVGPAVVAVAALPLVGLCLFRAATGRRWLRRLDGLVADPLAPRRGMQMVLLESSSRGGFFRKPWAWIVDPASAETRGLNVPLIRGQELVVPGSESAVEVLGVPRPRGIVVLVVGGVHVYPTARAQRYSSTKRLQWEAIDHTF